MKYQLIRWKCKTLKPFHTAGGHRPTLQTKIPFLKINDWCIIVNHVCHDCTMVQNNLESRYKYKAIRLFIRSFAHTTHSLTPLLVGQWLIRWLFYLWFFCSESRVPLTAFRQGPRGMTSPKGSQRQNSFRFMIETRISVWSKVEQDFHWNSDHYLSWSTGSDSSSLLTTASRSPRRYGQNLHIDYVPAPQLFLPYVKVINANPPNVWSIKQFSNPVYMINLGNEKNLRCFLTQIQSVPLNARLRDCTVP